MWKLIGTAVLAVSVAGGCANVGQSSEKASDGREAKWLEDWSEWRGVVLSDPLEITQRFLVKVSSVDAFEGSFELDVKLVSEEDTGEGLVSRGVIDLAGRFCDAWWKSSPVVMSGIEEFGPQGGEDWKLLKGDQSSKVACHTDESTFVVEHVRGKRLLTDEWPEWRTITVQNENASMKQDALVKAVWKDREQWTLEISVRIESGWIGIPEKWVRVGWADDLADDFCRDIAGKPSWLFVSHSKESTREDSKLVRRDHVLVYQCEDAREGNTGAFGPDRNDESAPPSR